MESHSCAHFTRSYSPQIKVSTFGVVWPEHNFQKALNKAMCSNVTLKLNGPVVAELAVWVKRNQVTKYIYETRLEKWTKFQEEEYYPIP
jgi:hypothetical protein